MNQSKLPEVWLRGPLPGISPALQPVVHALLQAQEEVHKFTEDFPSTLLWNKPAGVASVAFHLQHIRGVLDRLLTYAKGEMLTEQQLQELKMEGQKQNENISVDELVEQLNRQIEKTISQLQNFDQSILFDKREVGRAKLPSTVFGLIFHAAEHTMRHVGQILVTVRVLKDNGYKGDL